jgi:hypothetical protein
MGLFKPTAPLIPVAPAKSSADTSQTPRPTETKSSGKRAPTPKRKEVQARNQHPVITKDRKLARKRAREMQARERDSEYLAMKTGDINKMPLKDRGEEKLYIRNFVDSRFHLSQLFIPIALALVATLFLPPIKSDPVVANIFVILVYGFMLACGVEIFLQWRVMKKQMRDYFGPKLMFRGQGYTNYMFVRMLQFPKMRLPKVLPKQQIAEMMKRKRGPVR